MRARITPGDGDARHGTINGYNNLRCRCPECRAAWAIYHREWDHADPTRLVRKAQQARAALRRNRLLSEAARLQTRSAVLKASGHPRQAATVAREAAALRAQARELKAPSGA